MLTFHGNTLARRTAALLLLGLLGCNNADKGAEETPAGRFCSTLSEYATACPALATPCDQAMIDDCAGVVGLVSDGFLQSASDCIAGGGAPLTCLGGAIVGLKPSPAHEAFVAQFCDECALGVPGCADVLLGTSDGPPELKAASLLILPLGDSLVDALRAECASGLGCLATFPTCAQKVLVEQAIPEKTLQCVLDGFQGKLPADAPTAEELAACGLGGTGSASGASEASGATGSLPTTSGATDAVSSGEDPSAATSTSTSTSGDVSTGPMDPSVADTGDAGTTGMTGPDMGTGEMACEEAYKRHDECGQGGALPSDCTWCTYLICNFVDDFCCKTAWDDKCQAQAQERCAGACQAPGICEHSPCVAGSPLQSVCSDCVLAICMGKPSCCETEWDGECALMASDCGAC